MNFMPFRKMMGLTVIGLVFGVSGAYIWINWYPQYKAEKEIRENYNRLAETEKKYQEQVYKALAEDTYGGKTPEETLQLFISALRNGDIELASKYFVLDTKMESFGTPDFLSREKWRMALVQAKEGGRLIEISNNIDKASLSSLKQTSEDTVQYVVIGDDGLAENTIYLKLNSVSKVWKIESL